MSGGGGNTKFSYRNPVHGQKFVPGYACSYGRSGAVLRYGTVDRAPVRFTVYPDVDGKAPRKEDRKVILDHEVILPNDSRISFQNLINLTREKVAERNSGVGAFTREMLRVAAIDAEQELGFRLQADRTVRIEEVD